MKKQYINSETGERVKVACVIRVGEAGNRLVFKIKSGSRPLRDPMGYYRRACWDTFAEAQAELDDLAADMGWEECPRARAGAEEAEKEPRADYRRLYAAFEDDVSIHPQTSDVEDAETALSAALDGLDKAEALKLDALIGRAVRAYEMRGFLYGLNCSRRLP